ncbi:uncharacterized, partial [Tachysurus ichikawai]
LLTSPPCHLALPLNPSKDVLDPPACFLPVCAQAPMGKASMLGNAFHKTLGFYPEVQDSQWC